MRDHFPTAAPLPWKNPAVALEELAKLLAAMPAEQLAALDAKASASETVPYSTMACSAGRRRVASVGCGRSRARAHPPASVQAREWRMKYAEGRLMGGALTLDKLLKSK